MLYQGPSTVDASRRRCVLQSCTSLHHRRFDAISRASRMCWALAFPDRHRPNTFGLAFTIVSIQISVT